MNVFSLTKNCRDGHIPNLPIWSRAQWTLWDLSSLAPRRGKYLHRQTGAVISRQLLTLNSYYLHKARHHTALKAGSERFRTSLHWRSKILTAGFISIDRFPQNTAPICCLPFDRIGVRHPGIGASPGSPVCLKRVGNSVLSFDIWPAGSSTTRDACRGSVVDFCEWSDN